MKNMKRIGAILVLVAILMSMLASTAMAGSTYYTTAYVRMRKGAGTNFAPIKTLPTGTKVEKLASGKADNGVTWYKVKCKYGTGWVCASYLSSGGGSSSKKITLKSGKSYLRTGPGLGYRVLTTIPQGATVSYTKTAYDNRSPAVLWYKVKYNGYTGWVSSKYTKGSSKPSSGTVVATGGSTNIRSSASLNATVVGTLPKGASAKYQGSSKKDNRGVRWYKVKYNGTVGWVSSRYTKKY